MLKNAAKRSAQTSSPGPAPGIGQDFAAGWIASVPREVPDKATGATHPAEVSSERVALMRQSLWRNDCQVRVLVPIDENGTRRVLALR